MADDDEDDEEAPPPVIAPRPDHTKSVSSWKTDRPAFLCIAGLLLFREVFLLGNKLLLVFREKFCFLNLLRKYLISEYQLHKKSCS